MSAKPQDDALSQGLIELVLAAQGGDREAFVEIMERHQRAVYALALAMTGDAVQSDEVTQDTFVIAWRRLPEMQQPERFRGWLCGIARMLSRRVRRRGVRT